MTEGDDLPGVDVGGAVLLIAVIVMLLFAGFLAGIVTWLWW
jgi:hypothetical protein